MPMATELRSQSADLEPLIPEVSTTTPPSPVAWTLESMGRVDGNWQSEGQLSLAIVRSRCSVFAALGLLYQLPQLTADDVICGPLYAADWARPAVNEMRRVGLGEILQEPDVAFQQAVAARVRITLEGLMSVAFTDDDAKVTVVLNHLQRETLCA